MEDIIMINVVGTMFFRNRKLLLDKPRRRPTHQMIGGRSEDEAILNKAGISIADKDALSKNSERFASMLEAMD